MSLNERLPLAYQTAQLVCGEVHALHAYDTDFKARRYAASAKYTFEQFPGSGQPCKTAMLKGNHVCLLLIDLTHADRAVIVLEQSCVQGAIPRSL